MRFCVTDSIGFFSISLGHSLKPDYFPSTHLAEKGFPPPRGIPASESNRSSAGVTIESTFDEGSPKKFSKKSVPFEVK
jgi:hypothetical protein